MTAREQMAPHHDILFWFLLHFEILSPAEELFS